MRMGGKRGGGGTKREEEEGAKGSDDERKKENLEIKGRRKKGSKAWMDTRERKLGIMGRGKHRGKETKEASGLLP